MDSGAPSSVVSPVPDPPPEKRARTDEVSPLGGGAASGGGGARAGLPTDLDYLLCRASAFPNEEGELPSVIFKPGTVCGGGGGGGAAAAADEPDAPALVRAARVLVVGAGGLGCELLHSLALAGFVDVHVIDADTVDLTNLNRQFLFRHSDIGQPKAVAAAAAVSRRVPGCAVTPHVAYIQAREAAWYRQFAVVIGGLDNLTARRWLNSTLVSLSTAPGGAALHVPYIDGGTEGFKGQAQLVVPGVTACFDCTIDNFPPATTFQICTIAETPRRPEHCIAYAMLIQWEREQPAGRKLDTDSADDMMWVFTQAAERAKQYGIEGVTFTLTTGVVKTIIPAVASTNAVIASLCVLEALKIVSGASQTLNAYYGYFGQEGLATSVQTFERRADCLACGGREVTLRVPRGERLAALRDRLKALPALQLENPSLQFASGERGVMLYAPRPASLREQLAPNLEKSLAADLGLPDGAAINVHDPTMSDELGPLTCLVRYDD